MTFAIENMTTALAERDAQIAELSRLVQSLQATIQRQQVTINDLIRMLYGKRSEKLDPNQILMESLIIDATGAASPDTQLIPAPVAEEPTTPKRKSQHRGRVPFPEHLPHEEVIIPVAEEDKVCPESGEPRQFMGYEESKKLDYVPETLKVVVYKREKWGSPVGAEEEGVVTAPRPEAAVECMADTGLLAQVVISKFEDHLPLYRQERVFARQGVAVTRQTMAGWACGVANAVRPVVRLMRSRILDGPYVHHDDTPVKMLDPGAGKTKETRLWVAVGGDQQQYVHFEFTTNRSNDGPVRFFRDYVGHLMCDEYSGYSAVCGEDSQVIGLSCWAHARRYFDKAKLVESEAATRILAMIAQLYHIESLYREKGLDDLGRARIEQSRPQLERIKEALEADRQKWLPQSPMAKATEYVLKRWDAFTRYTTNPVLPIDNNAAERAVRAVAIGRKNWLFLGSENGGDTAAILMSIIGTAHHLGMNSWMYLNDVLKRLPSTPEDQLDQLLPDVWLSNNPKAKIQ